MVSDSDTPATYLNKEIMDTYAPQLKPFYYDEKKYDTYLEQLGISYPTLRKIETTTPTTGN
jgi:aminobenzoyl-glutamate utilization protein B